MNYIRPAIVFAWAIATFATTRAGPITITDLFVSDHNLAESNAPGIVRMDKATGAETLIAQGGYFADLFGIVYESSTTLVAIDAGFGNGKAIRVDVTTGSQSLIADGLGHSISAAVGPDGAIYVTDDGFGGPGGVRRIDPTTQAVTVISAGGRPGGIVYHPDGNLYFSGFAVNGGAPGVARLDPNTGTWESITPTGMLTGAGQLTVDLDGSLLVADAGTLAFGDSKVIRIDPDTGVQSLVSTGFGSSNLRGILVDPFGSIFLGDHGDNATPGLAGVFGMERYSGTLTELGSGTMFKNVFGLAGMTVGSRVDEPLSTGAAFGLVWVLTVLGFKWSRGAVLRSVDRWIRRRK